MMCIENNHSYSSHDSSATKILMSCGGNTFVLTRMSVGVSVTVRYALRFR
jgi:hypothetical protein